jgi:hypothetical protein
MELAMDDIDTIDVVVNATSEAAVGENTKGIFGRRAVIDDNSIEIRAIPISVIATNLKRIAEAASSALTSLSRVGSFELREVQMQVEVSAEGGVQLVGTAKAGGKGAITLTFERPVGESK